MRNLARLAIAACLLGTSAVAQFNGDQHDGNRRGGAKRARTVATNVWDPINVSVSSPTEMDEVLEFGC